MLFSALVNSAPIAGVVSLSLRIHGSMALECLCESIPTLNPITYCNVSLLSPECKSLYNTCECRQPTISLIQKRGFFSRCFGSSSVKEDDIVSSPDDIFSSPAEIHSEKIAAYIDGFVEKKLGKEKRLSTVLERFDEYVAERLGSITDERHRLALHNQLRIELATRFMPTFDESRAVFKNKIIGESVHERFKAILEEEISKSLDSDSYKGLLEQYRTVDIDEFETKMNDIGTWLEEHDFQNGVLLTAKLGDIHTNPKAETLVVKSVDWIASHLFRKKNLRPKYVVSSGKLFDQYHLTPGQEYAFHADLDFAIPRDPDSVTNFFLVDDGTFSGNQIAALVEYMKNYYDVNKNPDVGAITINIATVFSTEAARTRIKKINLERHPIKINFNEGETIPKLDTNPANGYPGTLAFEHNVPDDESFAGPYKFIESLKSQLSSNLPPYKNFEPQLRA